MYFLLTIALAFTAVEGRKTGDIVIASPSKDIVQLDNGTMSARYGMFFRLPGIYRPVRPAITTTLPACTATCCLTSCATPATNCTAAATPGMLGACMATPTVTGTFCRSIAPTCLAAVCTLPTSCTAKVPCANTAPSAAAPWIC